MGIPINCCCLRIFHHMLVGDIHKKTDQRNVKIFYFNNFAERQC